MFCVLNSWFASFFLENGILYSVLWLFWGVFALSLICIVISNRRFDKKSTITMGRVHSYERDSDNNFRVNILLLDIDKAYEARFGLNQSKYPVGSELEVAYIRDKNGICEIRRPNSSAGEKLFFILQLIPLLIIVALYVYSHFINPGYVVG